MSVLQSGRRLIVAVACLMLLCSIMVSANAMNRVDGERWAYRMDRFIPMAMQIDVNGQPYLYVAQKNGGLAVLNSSGRSAGQAVARLRITEFKGLDVTHLHQDGPFLYLSLGNFFNAAGSRHGMAIVDVSSPKRPAVRSVWVSDEITRGSSGIVVHDGVAYLGAMDQGVVALDITRPDRIRFLSLYQPDIHFPRPNPGRIQHPNARGLVIHQGALYVAYDAGGLRVLDISNPNRMHEIGRYLNPSPAARRKQQAYNNLLIEGSIAYIATDYCGMEIVDISNPGDIRQLGWWNEWTCDQASNNWFNSPGHTNQLVLDDHRAVMYLSSGDAELSAIDVRNARRPRTLWHLGEYRNKSGTWGVSADESTIYLGYIKTFVPFQGRWSGIKALDRRQLDKNGSMRH